MSRGIVTPNQSLNEKAMLCIQSIMFIKHNYSNFAQIHISTKYCGIKDYGVPVHRKRKYPFYIHGESHRATLPIKSHRYGQELPYRTRQLQMIPG